METYTATRSATRMVPTEAIVSVASGTRTIPINCAYQYGQAGSHNAKIIDVPLQERQNVTKQPSTNQVSKQALQIIACAVTRVWSTATVT
jgi:hypothetical protein